MYKNWSAICQLSDIWLKTYVALCTDSDQLKKLSVGFPELFSETEVSIRVPLSALVQKLPEFEYKFWRDVLDHFTIPYVWWGDSDEALSTEVPAELWEVYKGLPIDVGGGYSLKDHQNNPTLIEWKGEEFVVVDAIEEYPEEPTTMYMVATRFIDLAS